MKSARILIVENDRIVARDLAQQLARLGHVVAGTTSHGEEAADRVLDTGAELVLMDIHLDDGMDGVTAAQEIRDRCGVPVIFLTAYADETTVRRASRTEPFGYLLKPFEALQLMTVIELALFKHAAERELRISERRYATTLSSIADGVISTDGKAKIIFINPVAEALTGWSREEAMGRNITEVFQVENGITREGVEDPVVRALRSGLAESLPPHSVLRSRNGGEVPVDDSGAPVLGDDGAVLGAVLVFSDVTRRRQAEEALRRGQAELAHAARLTTLGELTVSIAHEVNQPLMAAVTNAEACIRWLNAPSPDVERAQEAARRVMRNGHRAAEVIRSIRALARNSKPEMVPFDLRPAVEDVLRLMQGELQGAGIALRTGFPPAPVVVTGDRVQLQQVVMNLVLNAREAIGAGETDGVIRVVLSERGGEVALAVEDSGPGIAAEIRDRIFEPLFTTKEGGLGLGLSICRSITDAHGGRIGVRPNGPTGSAFEIVLPGAVDGHHDHQG
ncbi:ATP-binding response regulator [Roseomonas populi]|uniref:histidine kinase n=1 Tax=Roseomonas populi TaxID=3121582 RepID=A0ABT1XAB3_9PROT|nr:ATP-binding protein [Roseomonas pecuniae]MCR0985056.1 ATP-binding protein [Roseomonas pecuniae]